MHVDRSTRFTLFKEEKKLGTPFKTPPKKRKKRTPTNPREVRGSRHLKVLSPPRRNLKSISAVCFLLRKPIGLKRESLHYSPARKCAGGGGAISRLLFFKASRARVIHFVLIFVEWQALSLMHQKIGVDRKSVV